MQIINFTSKKNTNGNDAMVFVTNITRESRKKVKSIGFWHGMDKNGLSFAINAPVVQKRNVTSGQRGTLRCVLEGFVKRLCT